MTSALSMAQGLVQQQAGIGDLSSDAKGSGARFNSGKPAIELVPLRLIASSYSNPDLPEEQRAAVTALAFLAEFQERLGDEAPLMTALAVLGIEEGWIECARVFDYGRRVKYAAWNWAKGMPWSVPLACAARHLLAILRGETTDPESGEPHRGHVFCNVAMLLTYLRTYREGDDRAASGLLAPARALP